MITTRCSGNTEIIKDGKTGFFVDRTVRAFVDKINVLKDSELLSKMSKDISKDIKANWGWDRRAKKWIDFCQE